MGTLTCENGPSSFLDVEVPPTRLVGAADEGPLAWSKIQTIDLILMLICIGSQGHSFFDFIKLNLPKPVSSEYDLAIFP